MEEASSTPERALEETELQRDETSSESQAANGSTCLWLMLPSGIWSSIAESLLPVIHPEDHVFPQPQCQALTDRKSFKATHSKDLLAMALTCTTLRDVALPKLYRTPFLSKGVKKFVRDLCRNDQDQLVPDTCNQALWIHALHLENPIREGSECKDFCACCVHVSLSLAPNIRHLSLRGLDETWDDECDELHDHPVVHFLASTTKCRPRSLTLMWDGFSMPVSITNATSFVPLSEVTHLHFISLTPPECLIAFLVGNADMIKAFGQPLAAQMQADIASGHSPNEKLECLRLSQLPEEALHHFGEYIAWRKATDAFSQLSPAKQALRTPLDEPDVLMEISGNSTVRDILYDLAVNSCRLPRLRLLILDTQLCPLTPPKDALKLLVEQGALTDVSKRFPGLPQSGCGCGSQEHYATTFVSSLFNDMKQNSEDGDSMNATNLLRSDEEAKSWSRLLDSMDEHWRLTQEGKHALIKLWNSSRSKNATNATVPVHTEIRIAAGRHCNLTSDELERDFHCAVENLKSPPTASSSNSKHDSGASHDLGLWADPDVFSVIETRPWLPYLQLNQYGCCFWTGELPRDNDASSRLPGSQSIVNPPIVPLDEAKLDEQAKLELERLKRARAMDELVEAKRQRIEAAGLDQSEPSIH